VEKRKPLIPAKISYQYHLADIQDFYGVTKGHKESLHYQFVLLILAFGIQDKLLYSEIISILFTFT